MNPTFWPSPLLPISETTWSRLQTSNVLIKSLFCCLSAIVTRLIAKPAAEKLADLTMNNKKYSLHVLTILWGSMQRDEKVEKNRKKKQDEVERKKRILNTRCFNYETWACDRLPIYLEKALFDQMKKGVRLICGNDVSVIEFRLKEDYKIHGVCRCKAETGEHIVERCREMGN